MQQISKAVHFLGRFCGRISRANPEGRRRLAGNDFGDEDEGGRKGRRSLLLDEQSKNRLLGAGESLWRGGCGGVEGGASPQEKFMYIYIACDWAAINYQIPLQPGCINSKLNIWQTPFFLWKSQYPCKNDYYVSRLYH